MASGRSSTPASSSSTTDARPRLHSPQSSPAPAAVSPPGRVAPLLRCDSRHRSGPGAWRGEDHLRRQPPAGAAAAMRLLPQSRQEGGRSRRDELCHDHARRRLRRGDHARQCQRQLSLPRRQPRRRAEDAPPIPRRSRRRSGSCSRPGSTAACWRRRGAWPWPPRRSGWRWRHPRPSGPRWCRCPDACPASLPCAPRSPTPVPRWPRAHGCRWWPSAAKSRSCCTAPTRSTSSACCPFPRDARTWCGSAPAVDS